MSSVIEEIRAIRKAVVRGGELKYKVICPEGYWFDANKGKCVKVTGAMKIKKKLAVKKALRTRKKHAAINKIHMKKSLRLTERTKRAKKAILNRKPKVISV